MKPFLQSIRDNHDVAKADDSDARLTLLNLRFDLLYSEQRFQVTGFDIDARKVNTLSNGGSYIYRIAAEEVQATKTNGFSATADYSQLTAMDAIVICVPAPLNEYHEPDLSYITDTTHSIAPHLRAGQLVVLESTTYPGTTEEVMAPILEKENKQGLRAARGQAPEEISFLWHFRQSARIPAHSRTARYSESCGGLKPASFGAGRHPLWLNLQSNHTRFVSGRGRNDEIVGKYLPLRQHRARERTQALVPAHGH